MNRLTVELVTGYRPKLDSQEGLRFLFSTYLDRLSSHPDSHPMGTEKFSRGGNLSGREADHSLSGAEFRNASYSTAKPSLC